MKLSILLYFVPIVYVSLIHATGLDPIKNFCSRCYHQSQVKNGVLFIDGGIASFSDRAPYSNPEAHDGGLNYTGPKILGPNNYVIAVSMSTSWDWKTNISEVAVNKTLALGTSNHVPKVQSAALFHGMPNDPQIYLYGGVTPTINASFPDSQSPTVDQYTLWGFNTATHGWTQYDVSLNVPERPSWGAFAEAPNYGLAFYLNGLLSNESSLGTAGANITTRTLEGLVVINLQNHTATNRSTDIITGGNPRTRGSMTYISQIGNMGILLLLGGATKTNEYLQPVSMDQVLMFDVESIMEPNSETSNNGWYTQTTTVEVPSSRIDFCVVSVSAPDNSSVNIYMYGGWDPTRFEYFDDIWVLSIPSFSWIKVFEGKSPRFGHSCHVVGNRQILTVGGVGEVSALDSCDWEYMGVAILDLTDIAWGSVFDSEKPPYQVSPRISEVIGGGLDGGATKRLPDGGWSSTLVAKLFTGTESQTAPYSPESGDSDTTDDSTGGSRKTNVGAIVGGVIGGVAFVVLVALLLWWWMRPKRDRASQARFDKPELEAASKRKSSVMDNTGAIYTADGSIAHEMAQAPSEMEGSTVLNELPGREIPAELEGGDTWRRSRSGRVPQTVVEES